MTHLVVEDADSRTKVNLLEAADTLKGDWVILATQLDISNAEISQINSDYKTVNDQALAMLTLWKNKNGDHATGGYKCYQYLFKVPDLYKFFGFANEVCCVTLYILNH